MIGKTSRGFFVFTRYFGMEWDEGEYSYLNAEQKRPFRLANAVGFYLRPLYVRIGRL